MQANILEIKNISKSFGTNEVLNNVNLNVGAGEFITLLGSSGCGKTTLLRILAGLEVPDSGSVILGGEDITQKAPNKRDMSMVFQSYALFPHMNVSANIAYSLKLKKASKTEMQEQVSYALTLVQLEGYENRMPNELSGGQKQRVAIARSIVSNPKILLLDEPLGALDLQLRRQMQIELKRLQKQLGITFIYITHDQEEALNMSSRIAVMRGGNFEQIGTPEQIYDYPKTNFVATFVGNANLIQGVVQSVDEKEGTMRVSCKSGCANASTLGHKFKEGDNVCIAIRSENIQFDKQCKCDMKAKVVEKSFAGGQLRLSLETADGLKLIASRHGIDIGINVDDDVMMNWSAKSAVPVDVDDAINANAHEKPAASAKEKSAMQSDEASAKEKSVTNANETKGAENKSEVQA